MQSRFGFSLFANAAKALITFGTGMLVARGLGPEEYGTMTFLLGTFTAARQLLDMGSSTAFFTFISQRQRSLRLVGWYSYWLALQFLIPLLFVGLLFPDAWIELIWKSNQRPMVVLAFIAAFMQSMLWLTIQQIAESQRLTQRVQMAAMVVALVNFLCIAFAWWSGLLAISTIFSLTIIEWLIAAYVIARNFNFTLMPEEHDTPKSVMAEFWRYCWPLIPFAYLSFAYEFADRWLLQNYAGSTQQAYYAVASQFGAVAAIATSSILNIFWKEIAEAYHKGINERVALLFRRVSRCLFFVASAGAGFLAPWAEEILKATLGVAYADGAATLMVMLFYPVHQSIGQIAGTLAYATGRVRTYAKIGMMSMVVSIVATYFMLADKTAYLPGMNLGSFGLAIKMVLIQIVSVNVLVFFLSRNLSIKFDWWFQPAILLFCIAGGLLAYEVPQWLYGTGIQLWHALLISTTIFFPMMLGLILVAPGLVGLHRENLVGAFSFFGRLVSGR